MQKQVQDDLTQPLLQHPQQYGSGDALAENKHAFPTCVKLRQAINIFKPSGLRLCCSAIPPEILALEAQIAICERQGGNNLTDISNDAVKQLYQTAIDYLKDRHFKASADEKQQGLLQYSQVGDGTEQLHVKLANQFLKLNYPRTLAFRSHVLSTKLEACLAQTKSESEDTKSFTGAPKAITELKVEAAVQIEHELKQIVLAVATGIPVDGYEAKTKAAIDKISLIGDILIEQVDAECKQVLNSEEAKSFNANTAYLTHLGLGCARIVYKALMEFNQTLPADLRNNLKKSAQVDLNKTLHTMGKAVVKAAAKKSEVKAVEADKDLMKLMNRSHIAINKFNADDKGGHEAKKYAGLMKQKAPKIFTFLQEQQKIMETRFTPKDSELQEALGKIAQPAVSSTLSYNP